MRRELDRIKRTHQKTNHLYKNEQKQKPRKIVTKVSNIISPINSERMFKSDSVLSTLRYNKEANPESPNEQLFSEMSHTILT